MAGRYGQATYWAFIAAIGYAAQHPLEKPFVTAFHNTLGGYVEIAFLSECIMVVALLAGLFHPRVRRVFRTMVTAGHLWNTITLSGLGVAGSILYVTALAHANPTYLSLILNLVPLYILVIIAIGDRKTPSARALIASAVGFAGIFTSALLVEGSAFDLREFFEEFLWFSGVPILFAIRTLRFAKLYGDEAEFSRVLVIAAFDAPFAFLVLSIVFALSGERIDLPQYSGTSATLFVCAIICAGILAQAALQKAQKAAGEDAQWYPGFFFFLIPFFVILFGLGMNSMIGDAGTSFHYGYLVGAAGVGLALVLLNFARLREFYKVCLHILADLA